jgi:hypothetical protein
MTTLFLIAGLFFPRITLLICYFGGSMPPNDTPFALDVVSGMVAPRLLIAYWTYTNHLHPLWTILYVVFFVGALGGSSSTTRSKQSKRSRSSTSNR